MKKFIITLIVIIIISMIGLTAYKFIIPTYTDVYSLNGDYIPSIRTVLDETRWVKQFDISTKNDVIFKKYDYGYQESVIEDLKTYTNYLIQMEQFNALKPYDLKDISNSSIYLGKKSHINEEYIILVNIEYTASNYKIAVSKKRGTILE